MSDLTYQGEAVPVEQKAALLKRVVSFRDEEAAFYRAQRRAGWWIGGIGAGIGVLGVVAAASVFPLKQPPQRIYFEVDRSTGWVGEAVGAADAPKLFNDRVAERALREYIEAREGFVWQTDDQAFHRVAIMSAPDEQRRYAADRHQHPPASAYGRDGYVRVANFHFTKRATGKQESQEYEVRFDRTEARGGTIGLPQPWTALVVLQFHSELSMNTQDRLVNPEGLQVMGYSSFADRAQ